VKGTRRFPLLQLLLLGVGLLVATARADSDRTQQLASLLRSGGYVILMRHASAPAEPPTRAATNPDNPAQERQLDATGRSQARDLGEALRRLRIPIGPIYSSPTYRAIETIAVAAVGRATPVPELGDFGHSMAPAANGRRALWLRTKAAETPPPGSNTLIVTHLPNILEAFPADVADLADGEALVLHPDGRGGSPLVARIKIDQWPRWGSSH
jgi:phosphohistidine phosphatase SixA